MKTHANGKPVIENPNSSGQGHHPAGPEHFLAETVTRAGYVYSHSTPVGRGNGSWYLLHTFSHAKHHTVSLMTEASGLDWESWSTSTGCASGRRWTGRGKPKLLAHLESKARRYSLKSAAPTR